MSASHRILRCAALFGLLAAGIFQHGTLQAEPNPAAAQGAMQPLAAHAVDAFYDPPRKIPRKPGTLLRSAPLKDVTLPAGIRGWRILYTTTIDDRTPATAVATVFAPSHPPKGKLRTITWAHGTTGLQQRCMPSLMTHPALGIPALDRIVKAGWAVIATDYSFAEKGGPHPYLIGEGEARAVLDALRAARRMREVRLDARTVVWGHSQGGHAALWTGILAPRYAPEIGIAGVAAIAPAANIAAILTANPPVDRRLGPYVAQAYSRFYPDIAFEQAVRPPVLAAAREVAGLCSFFPAEEAQRTTALTNSFEGGVLAMDTSAALRARLEQNAANGAIAAPVLVAQGAADTVVPVPVTDAYIEARCAAGQRLEYWRFFGLDHGTIVGAALDEPLVAWTVARFASAPQQSGCVRRMF